MANLTRQALKDLINKPGQALTLTKNYDVFKMPFDEQERYPDLGFEGDYARRDHKNHPALGVSRSVADSLTSGFLLSGVNGAGDPVNGWVDYPTKGNAILEGKKLTIKRGGALQVGSVVTHLIYNVAFI